MGLQPRIEVLSTKKLIGINMKMSLTDNKTFELWNSFILELKRACYPPAGYKYAIQVYPDKYFNEFNPSTQFVKWAAVEVDESMNTSDTLNPLTLEGGLYAVFDYKGPSDDKSIFQYIYSKWLPSSDYELDNRPHFEVLGEKYKNSDPNSEEEIWIPIQPK